MPQLSEGDMAPEFTLPTTDGGRISVTDLRGGPAVIYFYPKDDTPGCTAQATSFSLLMPEFERIGVRVVGISPDSVRKHGRFSAKHGLTVTLGSDTDAAAAQAYGVWAEKSMFGRKYMGIERTTFLLDGTGRIVRIWRKVKVRGHAEEVLTAAKEL